MCDYCSCRSIPVIEDLGDQHARLGVLAETVRRAAAAGDTVRARAVFDELVEVLRVHTAFEEATVFAALRSEGEMDDDVDGLLADLHVHIAREEYDLFPAMLMALSPAGWDAVERAAASCDGR
jgi:hypothetical protein